MEILGNIDPAHLPYIAVACALLCVGLIVIGLVLQAVSGVFEILFGLLEVLTGVLQGGPVSWCGCAFLILGLAAAAVVAVLLLNAPASCADYPTNFCLWLGFLP